MNEAKIESKKEMIYLKYRKSSIFDPLPCNTGINDKSNITEKVTERKYDKIFRPKIETLPSQQRYIQSLYKNDLNNLTFTPKKVLSKIKRKNIRAKSVNPKIYKNLILNSFNENNFNKKSQNIFQKQNLNNYDEKRLHILRTTTNHRVRSLYSRYSDIFHLNNNESLYPEIKKYKSSIMTSRKKNKNTISKIPEYLKQKIKPLDRNYNKIRFPKKNFNTETNSRYNRIKSEREKEELLRKKVKQKEFNRKKISNIFNNTNESMPTLYQFKKKLNNKKTNLNNVESVGYNILNNKKSNKTEEYITLSSKKPSFLKLTSYEIKIPKNFNQANDLKLKKLLTSEGIHFFDFSETGDLIGGSKGKFVFKVRNSDNDNNFDDKIKKINSKFSKMNVKLKRDDVNYLKKKTDLVVDIPIFCRNIHSKKKVKKK